MRGMGTLLNTAAVIVGCALGLLLRKGLKETMQHALMQACGLATMLIGLSGVLSRMLVVENGVIGAQGTMLLLLSLIPGTLLGEAIDIEKGFERLGDRIRRTVGRGGDNCFIDGFVNASLTVCIGAMAIVGSIEDGLRGDFSMLAAKSLLDLVIVMVMASVYGVGTGFAALPVLVLQGSITILAALCGNFVSEAMVRDISLVGSALVLCVGINIAFGRRFRVGNMLPALLFAILYSMISTAL